MFHDGCNRFLFLFFVRRWEGARCTSSRRYERTRRPFWSCGWKSERVHLYPIQKSTLKTVDYSVSSSIGVISRVKRLIWYCCQSQSSIEYFNQFLTSICLKGKLSIFGRASIGFDISRKYANPVASCSMVYMQYLWSDMMSRLDVIWYGNTWYEIWFYHQLYNFVTQPRLTIEDSHIQIHNSKRVHSHVNVQVLTSMTCRSHTIIR